MDVGITTKRLNEAFIFLKQNGKASTQKDVADAMGSVPSNVSKAFKGDERYLTQKFLVRFNHAFGDIFNPDWLEGKEDLIKFREKFEVAIMPCYYNETTRYFHANGDDWPSESKEWYKICNASYVKWDTFRTAIYNYITDQNYDASNQFVKELWIDYNYSYNNGTDSEWQPPEDILKNFRGVRTINSMSTNSAVEDFSLVPLINIDSVGGMDSSNALEAGDQFVERFIPFTGAQPGDRAIYQSGDSMTPTIPSGSIIQIRKVDSWREYFGYGGIFVLWLKDNRRITKQVMKYTPDPQNYVTCHSFNPDSADEELPKSFIREVWKVIKVLTDKGW